MVGRAQGRWAGKGGKQTVDEGDRPLLQNLEALGDDGDDRDWAWFESSEDFPS